MLIDAWESWKQPFHELSRLSDTASCAQSFRRALPAWMYGEQQRHASFLKHLRANFAGQSLIAVHRMMCEPLDTLQPVAFSDIVLHWLPTADAAHHNVSQHGARVQQWMEAASISKAGTSRIFRAKQDSELLDFEAAYQKCFFVKAVLYRSDESDDGSSQALRPTSSASTSLASTSLASTSSASTSSASTSLASTTSSTSTWPVFTDRPDQPVRRPPPVPNTPSP
jgi:hypothetical protein